MAWFVCAAERATGQAGLVVSALLSTGVLYVLVYASCFANLYGRPRSLVASGGTTTSKSAASLRVALTSIMWHPIGSAFERYWHSVPSTMRSSSLPPVFSIVGFGVRLLLFEIIFDFVFYLAHRGVHASPFLYRVVHKLHHSHSHDVRLISGLQMGPLDGKGVQVVDGQVVWVCAC